MHHKSIQFSSLVVISFSCFIFFLATQATTALAQGDNPAQSIRMLKRDMAKVDKEIEELTNKRQALRQQLDDGASFSSQASVWFDKLNRLNQQIREVEKHPYDTYKGQNKDALLNKMKQERGVLASLNGGTVIGDRQYSSIQQLKAAFDQEAKETAEVLKKYNKLISEIEALHRKRDALEMQYKEVASRDSEDIRKEIRDLEGTIQHLEEIISRENVWIMVPGTTTYTDQKGKDQTDYLYADKNLIIMSLLITHREQGNLDGTGVDLNKVKEMISIRRNQSIHMKNVIRKEKVPELEQRISALRSQLDLQETLREANIEGCWKILLPGSNDLPVILIVDRGQGTYDGYIQHRGSLITKYRKNYRLFRVQRTSGIAFGGTENSYTADGGIANVPLRLTVNPDGRSMTYATDETLQLKQAICE